MPNFFMKHILQLVNYCKNIITSTQPTFLPCHFGLCQRPSSEEVCSIPLPVLATIVMRPGKKSVMDFTSVLCSITSKHFTRNQHASSLSEQNKSALTDHASHDNHVINWPASTVLDRECDKSTRWIKEAVHTRKEGRQSLNRDEGSYTLSHTYDRFLATSHNYRGKRN